MRMIRSIQLLQLRLRRLRMIIIISIIITATSTTGTGSTMTKKGTVVTSFLFRLTPMTRNTATTTTVSTGTTNAINHHHYHHRCRRWNTVVSSSSSTASSSTASSSFHQQSLMDRVTTPTATTATTTTTTPTTTTTNMTNPINTAVVSNFPQTWIPLCSIYEMDGRRPNSVYFMGQEYIVYQSQINSQNSTTSTTSSSSSSNKKKNDDDIDGWCVIDPYCSHRLAPLREGRIIPSTSYIQCSYHGWTFDGIYNNNNNNKNNNTNNKNNNNNNCVSIPQLDDTANNTMTNTKTQRILNHPSCGVQTYPCMVHKNILWAWLWGSSSSSSSSSSSNNNNNNYNNNDNALIYTHLPEYYLNHLPNHMTATYTRILPYSYDTLIENIMDISHVPFAHHNLQGTRNDVHITKPTIQTTIQPLLSTSTTTTATTNSSSSSLLLDTLMDGFVFHFTDSTGQMTRIGNCTFKAPYMVHYNAQFTQTLAPFALTTLLIPVSAGYSKIIIFSPSSPSPSTSSSSSNTTSNSNVATTTTTNDHHESDNDNVAVTAITTATTEPIDTNTLTTTTEIKRAKPPPQQSFRSRIQRFIFPRLPIWFLHTFSSRFLDSDLMLLHDQEITVQERRRRATTTTRKKTSSIQSVVVPVVSSSSNPSNSNDGDVVRDEVDTAKSILEQYFMPSKADRSVYMIRNWISRYASAVYDLSSSSSSIATTIPQPPYKDRTLLFDRYNQHTKHCKHCNTMLEVTLPKYKKYSHLLLSIGIVLWNKHWLFRLFCIGCITSFRMYNSIERTLRTGDFDHSKNH